jgi:ATP-dependent RNA helicase DHX36
MRAVLMAGAYPTIGRLLPANNGSRPVVETPSGVKVRLHPRSCNINLAFSESSGNPLVIYDEVIRGDHGMYIKNSSVAGSYPLFLLSAEMVVAPSDNGDEVKEGSSEEKEEIMSSPDTTVTIIVDRWLRFKAMALDVAQIYCLRERLASAILFKVR